MLSRENFDNRIFERISKCQDTLTKKNKEYSDGEAPLHNFYEGAKIMRTTPEKCAMAYMTKHLISFFDMIENPEKHSQELWDEKLGDILNYFLLIDTLIYEKLNKENNK